MKSKLYKLLPLALALMVFLGACGGKDSSRSANNGRNVDGGVKGITIAASFYPMYIMTLNVAKDIPNVRVVDMTKSATGCLHDYSVTPDDMKNLEDARFLVVNGAEMESFMDKVLDQFPHLKTIDSSKGIELIKGDGDEGDNPHLWVSITNAIQQVKNIGEQLALLDPDHAVQYKENTDQYVKKLETEKEKMHKTLDGLKNRDIITFHEAFPYFAKEFNLNIAGVIEREPGSEPSAKDLKETVETIQKLKVKALFAEPQYSSSAAKIISRETDSKVYTLDPAVTGPMDRDAYIRIMDNNLKVLQEALK